MTYALLPHSGDWRWGELPAAGRELVHPLIARVVGPHEGPLPAQLGFSRPPRGQR